jgi:hypothetical protein
MEKNEAPATTGRRVTGVDWDGDRLEARAPLQRIQDTIWVAVYLCMADRVDGRSVDRVVHVLSWYMLLARPSLSVFQETYTWLNHARKRVVEMPEVVRREILVAACLGPQLRAALDVPLCATVQATDASLGGGGICETELDEELLHQEADLADHRGTRLALAAERHSLARQLLKAEGPEARARAHDALDHADALSISEGPSGPTFLAEQGEKRPGRARAVLELGRARGLTSRLLGGAGFEVVSLDAESRDCQIERATRRLHEGRYGWLLWYPSGPTWSVARRPPLRSAAQSEGLATLRGRRKKDVDKDNVAVVKELALVTAALAEKVTVIVVAPGTSYLWPWLKQSLGELFGEGLAKTVRSDCTTTFEERPSGYERRLRIWSSDPLVVERLVVPPKATLLSTSVCRPSSEWDSCGQRLGQAILDSLEREYMSMAEQGVLFPVPDTAPVVHVCPAVLAKRWRVVSAYPWRRGAHINVLEAQVAVTALERTCRSSRRVGLGHIVYIDSLAVLGALRKGRSSAKRLNAFCRRAAALELAFRLTAYFRWIRSADNPADEPSRRWGEPEPPPPTTPRARRPKEGVVSGA